MPPQWAAIRAGLLETGNALISLPPGTGKTLLGELCLMAALGCDAARQSPKVRRVFTENAMRLMNGMKGLLKGRVDEAQVHQQALVTLASLVGAQVIARAVDDEKLSREVLRSVAASVLKH